MVKFENDTGISVSPNIMELFEAYKKKAVFNVKLTAMPDNPYNREKTNIITIYDNRTDPPYQVGRMWWDGSEYTVECENIQNEKFARWNSAYHTKSTGDLKRAVKNALDYLRPFTWGMVAEKSRREALGQLTKWVNAPRTQIQEALHYKISKNDLQQEIEAALRDGRDFINNNFNLAKQVMQDHMDEATRREYLELHALFVFVDEHGRYSSDRWANTKQEHELHPDIATKISLLKLIDIKKGEEVSEMIEEVGMRSGKNCFWVYVSHNVLKESEQ